MYRDQNHFITPGSPRQTQITSSDTGHLIRHRSPHQTKIIFYQIKITYQTKVTSSDHDHLTSSDQGHLIKPRSSDQTKTSSHQIKITSYQTKVNSLDPGHLIRTKINSHQTKITSPDQRHLIRLRSPSHCGLVQFENVYALGKPFMRSTPSLTTFVILAFRTVPALVWFKMALSRLLVLSRKIVVRFFFARPSPPGDRSFDALGFTAAGSVSSSIVLWLHACPVVSLDSVMSGTAHSR